MKKSICIALLMISLPGLNACSGKAPINMAYPANMAQNTAVSPVSLNSPVNQLASTSLNSETHSPAQSDAPGKQAVLLPPGSRPYDRSVFLQAAPKMPQTKPIKVPAVVSAPRPAAPPQTLPASKISAAQELLSKAKKRFQSLNSFKINVEGFEMLSGKSPSRLSFNMFANQGRAKIEVLKHTNSLYVGVKMGYQAGADAISVRPGGALGFVKIDTKMSDDRLSTPRGYRLDQIDAFAISQRLLGGSEAPKVLGKTQINGRSVAILEYTHSNTYDQRITRELLGIDMEDHFIRIHEMYEGSTLVFSLKLSNVQLDVPVASTEMEI